MKIIKQLAEQAGMVKILDEHASEYGNGMFENTLYPELEKFAELIVRECANTLEFHGFDDAVPYINWMAANKLGVKG